MESRWRDEDAARFTSALDLRVYTSRLIGSDPELVLHGGGNTSLKLRAPDIFGDQQDLLYVKGSGWDLGTIEAAGFAPVLQQHVLRLTTLDDLSDAAMSAELRRATLDPAAPSPSVETILHALIPFPFVDHTHADALLALTNTPSGQEHVRRAFGDSVIVVPYVMPGFRLAKACAGLLPREFPPGGVGIVLLNHGLFTFGSSAKESYERMIALVHRAEDYLRSKQAWSLSPTPATPEPPPRAKLAELRRAVSKAADRPMILSYHADAVCSSFVGRADLEAISQRGPATPDHVIRTKRLPQVGPDVEAFAADYRAYFDAHAPRAAGALQMLDTAPRVVLDPTLGGVCSIGRSAEDAAAVHEIYHHTIQIVERAERLERYQALPPEDILEVEYWDLEQAKLRRKGNPGDFAGEIALVTGAGSGIGRACVQTLRRRGAAVAALDLNPSVTAACSGSTYLGLVCDVTDAPAVDRALDAAVRAFGGVDVLVLNAGIFPASHGIDALEDREWASVLDVNLTANLRLLRAAHPLLRCAPGGGRVVVIGSKNVPAPGPGAGAYSASKAALTQLARVAALEWGKDGIRVNVVHPNAVFDTGLWTTEGLEARAQHYGLSVDEYRRNNVLRVNVTSRDVGEVVAELCGPAFSRTTGAQVPVDGGNERVI